jgi:hypothetical protein
VTPDERARADALSATAFQLSSDLADALVWGEGAQAMRIRDELSRVCRELVPLLCQYESEQREWREGRYHHGS